MKLYIYCGFIDVLLHFWWRLEGPQFSYSLFVCIFLSMLIISLLSPYVGIEENVGKREETKVAPAPLPLLLLFIQVEKDVRGSV